MSAGRTGSGEERITVTGSEIIVRGGAVPKNICQCGHPKSFHTCGEYGCWHLAAEGPLRYCQCHNYVDAHPDTRPWWKRLFGIGA